MPFELARGIVVQDLLGFLDAWRRAGSPRPRVPVRRSMRGRAPARPRRRSPRGPRWRRGSTARPARTARGRRRPSAGAPGSSSDAQEAGQPGVRRAGGGGAGVELSTAASAGSGPVRRSRRRRRAWRRSRPSAACLVACSITARHLAGGGHLAAGHGRAQRLDVAVHRGRDVVRPGRRCASHCPAVSVGIRSKIGADVLGGRGDVVQLGCVASPISWISSCRPSRSRMASSVTASTSSTGSQRRPARRGPRARRPRTPRGRRGRSPGISVSCPGRPSSVAKLGLSADQGVRVGVGDGVDGGLRATGCWGSCRYAATQSPGETGRRPVAVHLSDKAYLGPVVPFPARRAPGAAAALSRGCAARPRDRASAPAAAAAGGPTAGAPGFPVPPCCAADARGGPTGSASARQSPPPVARGDGRDCGRGSSAAEHRAVGRRDGSRLGRLRGWSGAAAASVGVVTAGCSRASWRAGSPACPAARAGPLMICDPGLGRGDDGVHVAELGGR